VKEVVKMIYKVTDDTPIALQTSGEREMRDSELRYRRLFETAQDGILILNAVTGQIEDVNPYLIKMLGYSREEFINKTLWEMGAFKDIKANQIAFKKLQTNEYIRYEGLPLKTKDEQLIQVEFVSNVYLVGSEKVIQCNIRDITEHRRIIAALHENERKYFDLVNQSEEGVFIIELSGEILTANRAMCEELGYTEKEFLLKNIWEIVPKERLEEYRISLTKVLEGMSLKEAKEYSILGKDGKVHYIEVLSAPRFNGKNVIGFQGIARDVTQRNQQIEQIQRQLDHLTALSGIDRVIAANFDLELSLAEILNQVIIELGVDAADILLLNSDLQVLVFGSEHGFHNNSIKNVQVRMGESYAGRAAQEHKLIRIANLQNEQDKLFLTTLFKGEDFVCYYCVPLIIKGNIKGVLEVFNRSILNPDIEWFNFLNTLSGQAAIAIEIATLFDNLQRSNSQITMAYDATIEGWSRALDMRDKETEGHTQRVTEMTVKLARAFGMSDAELAQVRWGALLHDIGKMGVPDNILLKPGPLTDEDLIVMKKHPTLAYEMISPIRYLRLALDIPYSHHEKWDGTGYPQGLKGTQIPLVARIFAVVDVWDALTSDRPYRAAWTKEKALNYISTSSGSHFDPQVVDMFLPILEQSTVYPGSHAIP
jgi:PAS domain S-box-containing protein/putative nucleotidyltransferase with HDIG domain